MKFILMIKRIMKSLLETPLNEGHFLEMMDRLHVVMSTIDEHMLNHLVAESYEGIKEEIENAIHHLTEAYQLTGVANREFKDET